jgi:hypothetical protein
MNGTLPGPTAPASTSSEANLALTGSSTRSGPTVHGARAPREDWHAPPQASRLAAMLDETDHPMLLLHATKLTVLHANRAAVQELGDPSQSTDTGRSALDRQAQEHPLHVREGQLKARDSRDDEQLLATIDDARRRGLRRLLTLGKREAALSIAVTPMRVASARAHPSRVRRAAKAVRRPRADSNRTTACRGRVDRALATRIGTRQNRCTRLA